MKLLRNVFCVLMLFCFNISSLVLASTRSEISLALVEYDCCASTYKGCKVNFEVFTGEDNQRDRIWCGQLKFSAPKKLNEFDSRTYYNPLVRLEYITDSVDYNTSFGSAPPRLTQFDDDFIYQPTKGLTEHDILKSNLVTWHLDLPMSIKDVVDTVYRLRDSKGNFPKYKLVGYDWYNNVANCVTFSCRFLKEFGVAIDSCPELNKWLNPVGKTGFFGGLSYYSYYTLGFGWANDNIQSQYAIEQINQNKNLVVWRKSKKTSSAPKFMKKLIGDAFTEGFEKSIQ